MLISQLPFFILQLMVIYTFILSAFYLWCIIRSINAGIGKMFCTIYIFLFAGSFVCMYGFDYILRDINLRYPFSAFSKWMLEMPAVVVFSAVMLLTAFAVIGQIIISKRIASMLTPASLQEGLDLMPDGIAFGTEDGIPLLVNQKMQSISTAAFGAGVLDTQLLGSRISSGNTEDGCRIMHRGEGVFLHMADGSVWDMREHHTVMGNTEVCEHIAYNITEQYQKSMELTIRNKHLAAVNNKIREYNKNIDSIIRDKEILAAKINLHDNIGRSLLVLRSYLSRNDGNREQLIALWQAVISMLRNESVSNEKENSISILVKAAQDVGVKICFDGELPSDKKTEKIISLAIHESLINAVKYAGSDELLIKMKENHKTVAVRITNNGTVPEDTVVEKGGLKNLRRTVELNGGSMRIISKPVFVLEIVLEKE